MSPLVPPLLTPPFVSSFYLLRNRLHLELLPWRTRPAKRRIIFHLPRHIFRPHWHCSSAERLLFEGSPGRLCVCKNGVKCGHDCGAADQFGNKPSLPRPFVCLIFVIPSLYLSSHPLIYVVSPYVFSFSLCPPPPPLFIFMLPLTTPTPHIIHPLTFITHPLTLSPSLSPPPPPPSLSPPPPPPPPPPSQGFATIMQFGSLCVNPSTSYLSTSSALVNDLGVTPNPVVAISYYNGRRVATYLPNEQSPRLLSWGIDMGETNIRRERQTACFSCSKSLETLSCICHYVPYIDPPPLFDHIPLRLSSPPTHHPPCLSIL